MATPIPPDDSRAPNPLPPVVLPEGTDDIPTQVMAPHEVTPAPAPTSAFPSTPADPIFGPGSDPGPTQDFGPPLVATAPLPVVPADDVAAAPQPKPKRRARFPVVLTLGFALVCGLGLWWAYEYLVCSATGQRLDQAAILGGGLGRTISEDQASAILNVVSVAVVAAAIVIVFVIAIARKRVWVALSAAAVIAGANVTTQLLKLALLTRPDVGVTPGAGNSFPSGHTTVATSIAVALIMVVGPKLRPLVAVLGAGYAIATGVATVIMGWHRPSDVIGAMFVCGLWAGIVMVIVGLLRGRPSGSTGTIKGASLVLVFGGLVAAGGGALIGYGLIGHLPADHALFTIADLTKTDAALAFLAGVLVICGVAAFVAGGVMRLVSGTKKRRA